LFKKHTGVCGYDQTVYFVNFKLNKNLFKKAAVKIEKLCVPLGYLGIYIISQLKVYSIATLLTLKKIFKWPVIVFATQEILDIMSDKSLF